MILSPSVPVLGVALPKWNFPNNLAHKLYEGCTTDQEMVMVQVTLQALTTSIYSFIRSLWSTAIVEEYMAKVAVMFPVYVAFSTFMLRNLLCPSHSRM